MLPLNSDRIGADFRRANALQKSGRLTEARDILNQIVSAAPKMTEAHFQLGRVAFLAGDAPEAIKHLEAARKLRPGEATILSALAEVFATDGQHDAALKIHDRLISKSPKDVGPRIDKALLLQQSGDFAAAERELRKVLRQDPYRGEAYRMISATRKFVAGDPLIDQMKKALSSPKLSDESKVQIGFALAKAMEDTGKTADVFRYLKPANATMKAAYRYRVADRQEEVDGLISAFRGHDFSAQSDVPVEFAPIFVTGLPRSGTTLVEQILASHSDVTGGGELPFALKLAYNVIRTPGVGFKPMSDVRDEELTAFSEAYEKATRRAVGFERIMTDKAIQSHLIMGFLKQAIPAARFIVVRRDPRDLLYSIYKNMFAPGTHRYAYDLDDLAAYYASFLKILDFWREALPGGFHEVHYEDLVADPEAQTRALVAAAGLQWEDACLSFHEGKREVKTLSIQQVRQPIYRSSAQAWRKYETELAPLIARLEQEGVL